MKRKFHYLICLPILFSMLACQVFSLPVWPAPKAANQHIAGKPTSADLPAQASQPGKLLTPTLSTPAQAPTASVTATPAITSIPQATQLSIFEDIWTIVKDTYVDPKLNGLDWSAVHAELVQKINSGLDNEHFYFAMGDLIFLLGDDHSFFLDPQQVARQQAELEGKHDYVGIGVITGAVPARHRAVILSVITGSSAEAAGLQPRDSILEVNGSSILDEQGFLRDIVRGPENTSLTLTVQTPGDLPRHTLLTRQHVTGNYPLAYQVLTTPEGKRVGYVLLITFEDGTVDDQLKSALGEMSSAAPLDGLILDNRMNNGGTSAVLEPVLSFFTGGRLGYYLHQGEQRPFEVTLDDIQGSSQVPLVVLIGSGTASYGEIFAGILQDIGRAYLIGTTTQGNVEILWGYDLQDGSQLWLANETFLPLNHPEQNWESTGIIPDLAVSADFDEYPLASDPAILAALRYLADQ